VKPLWRFWIVLVLLMALAAVFWVGYGRHKAAALVALSKTYQIVEIAPLPGCDNSQGRAINASGQVTGLALAFRPGHAPFISHGFVWTNGRSVDLGIAPGFVGSVGLGLNNAGQIVGRLETAAPKPRAIPHGVQFSEPMWRGFLSAGKKKTALPLPPGCAESSANGINDSGQIVGIANHANSVYGQSFLYSKGRLTDLGNLGKYGGHAPIGSTAAGINRSGQIVGTSFASGGFDMISHAYFYAQGRMHLIGEPPDFEYSIGTAINNQGQVTGFAAKEGPSYDYGGLRRAFLWQNGVIKNLGTLPGFRDSIGTALNSRGDVVGSAESLPLLDEWFHSHLPFNSTSPLNPPSHAFLSRDGQMYDLNDLVPAGSGWVLEIADGINDKGQIVGTGKHNGKTRAFVLTPLKREEPL
jgi:probable HAF family extracellular repeat protein